MAGTRTLSKKTLRVTWPPLQPILFSLLPKLRLAEGCGTSTAVIYGEEEEDEGDEEDEEDEEEGWAMCLHIIM